MKRIFFAVLILGLIAGCKQSGPRLAKSKDAVLASAVFPSAEFKESSNVERISAESERNDKIQSSVQTAYQQKKIIRDGSLTLQVNDIKYARKQVDIMVMEYGGYIGSESYNSYEQESRYLLTIRVPASRFDGLMKRIETGTGEVLYKDINARDVTEEYIDLETRLANKHKFAERYKELLKKAGTVKDMIEIEESIRNIEEEIESTEGRLRYLNDQVSFSKLTLTLTQEKNYTFKPQHTSNFYEKFKESLHKGWKGFVGFLLLMLKIWPFWILAAVGWIIYRRYKKRKKITTGYKKNN